MGNSAGKAGRQVAQGAQVAGKMGSAAPVPALPAEDSRTSGRAPRNRGGGWGMLARKVYVGGLPLRHEARSVSEREARPGRFPDLAALLAERGLWAA